jgi:hypothetical protein
VGTWVIIHSLSIKCRGAATFFVDSLVFSSLTRETERYPLFFPFFSFALTTGLLPLCEKQELELVLGFFKENKILFQDSLKFLRFRFFQHSYSILSKPRTSSHSLTKRDLYLASIAI